MSQATGVLTGALAWQRTDTVGTELVIPDGDLKASGTAVVFGAKPYTTTWQVRLGDDYAVRELAVTVNGHGWSRELQLTRGDDWTCRTQASGDLDAPEPGLEDLSRLAGVVRLAASPIFLSWAMRALHVEANTAVTAPTVRVLTPSLAVVAGESRYQRLENRLRVSGDEPATSYDLDGAGMVTYQPGRLRIVR